MMKNLTGNNSEREIIRANDILKKLKKEYPAARIALNFNSPFQLLISTILSAQCNDERVNIVTKTLFKKYKSPQDFIRLSTIELEKEIFSTGFYKQKAKNIKNCCKVLVEKFKSEVPKNFDELVSLPGVGRKTASVVVGNAFGIPAIAVDTHVIRLSNLMGFIALESPEKIEERLKELFPKKEWINLGHYLMNHGRNTCIARRPKCLSCIVGNLCPSFNPIER
ncbi:MAG: endonuclease III [Ignavibacteriaceae bacterium]|nr:endonuclease III [Ignavibacteria bacterium]NNJ53940.1 endonuclease III [Ignavibacteriaceae bacterium]